MKSTLNFMKFHKEHLFFDRLPITSAPDLCTYVMFHLAYTLVPRPGETCYIPLKNPCEIHLEPVVLIEMKGHSLEEALSAATKAAHDGMENTENMVATMGKAKTLGKRAIGHPDPGALSTYLILSLMMEYLICGNS